MADDRRKQDLEDEMNRFEQEIAGNLPPPPKMPNMPNMMGGPPNFGGPPMPPFMNQRRDRGAPQRMQFPGPPPQMPPNMFGPPMEGLPPPPGMPPGMMPPPMMVPPPMMPMPPMGPPGQKNIIPPTVPLRNFDQPIPSMVMPGIDGPSASALATAAASSSGGGIGGAGPSNEKKKKKKTVVRVAGSSVWEDGTLLEWDPNDFRIFVGDIGNEVSDDALLRAFSRYPSLLKAKVVRDRKSKKTKGFGFVSFKDPQDYLKAMREMNGKYVGNRPIKLRKSTWKDRNILVAKKKEKEKKKLGLR